MNPTVEYTDIDYLAEPPDLDAAPMFTVIGGPRSAAAPLPCGGIASILPGGCPIYQKDGRPARGPWGDAGPDVAREYIATGLYRWAAIGHTDGFDASGEHAVPSRRVRQKALAVGLRLADEPRFADCLADAAADAGIALDIDVATKQSALALAQAGFTLVKLPDSTESTHYRWYVVDVAPALFQTVEFRDTATEQQVSAGILFDLLVANLGNAQVMEAVAGILGGVVGWKLDDNIALYLAPKEKLVEAACREASFAFWEKVAEAFPTATTGDFPPDADFAWTAAAEAAINTWAEANVPGWEDE